MIHLKKKKKGKEINDVYYDSEISNYEALFAWSNEKCTPLIREITFENAEVIYLKFNY